MLSPQFKRNKISNMKEQTEMVMMVAEKLDDETLLKKIPWITVDEIPNILKNNDAKAVSGLSSMEELNQVLEGDEA